MEMRNRFSAVGHDANGKQLVVYFDEIMTETEARQRTDHIVMYSDFEDDGLCDVTLTENGEDIDVFGIA